jgi:hypothetical protein
VLDLGLNEVELGKGLFAHRDDLPDSTYSRLLHSTHRLDGNLAAYPPSDPTRPHFPPLPPQPEQALAASSEISSPDLSATSLPPIVVSKPPLKPLKAPTLSSVVDSDYEGARREEVVEKEDGVTDSKSDEPLIPGGFNSNGTPLSLYPQLSHSHSQSFPFTAPPAPPPRFFRFSGLFKLLHDLTMSTPSPASPADISGLEERSEEPSAMSSRPASPPPAVPIEKPDELCNSTVKLPEPKQPKQPAKASRGRGRGRRGRGKGRGVIEEFACGTHLHPSPSPHTHTSSSSRR